MTVNTKQTYTVTADGNPVDEDGCSEYGIKVTVTQAGETVIGIGYAPTIAEAFDVAHDNFVRGITSEWEARVRRRS